MAKIRPVQKFPIMESNWLLFLPFMGTSKSCHFWQPACWEVATLATLCLSKLPKVATSGHPKVATNGSKTAPSHPWIVQAWLEGEGGKVILYPLPPPPHTQKNIYMWSRDQWSSYIINPVVLEFNCVLACTSEDCS